MTVHERLVVAASLCPEGFSIQSNRTQALLTEIAQVGRYTLTNDGVVVLTPFPLTDMMQAQTQLAPHLSLDDFVRQLHVYATTFVGGGTIRGRVYRVYLHEEGWRVVELRDEPPSFARLMDDAALFSWLKEAQIAKAA